MRLQPDWGTYIPGLVTLEGSFRINAATTPDEIRDGNTNIITSVARVSAGLFTVTFDSGFPIPEKLVSWHVDLAQGVAPGAEYSDAKMVVDSYSQASRSFQIQVLDYDTHTANDPVDNDTVSFMLRGSVTSAGTD